MATIKTRIINKHESQLDWDKAVNFIPLQGEIIIYDSTDNNVPSRIKIGDGSTLLADLPFFADNRLIWDNFTDAPVVEKDTKSWGEF